MKIAAALAFAIAVVAAIIRFTIAGEPLWLDELHTAWVSGGEFFEVFPRAASGNQSPLYFWLSWSSRQAFGSSVLALRWMSLVSGLLLLLVACRFVGRATQSLVGVMLTATLIAFDWRFVFYATEARPYALMQVLGLLQAYCFVDLMGWFGDRPVSDSQPAPRSTGLRVAWTVFSIAMIYSHVTSVWLLVAEFATVLVLTFVGRREQKMRLLRALAVPAVMVVLATMPLFIGLRETYGRRTNWSSLSSPLSVWGDLKNPLLIWVILPLVALSIDLVRRRLKKTNPPDRCSMGGPNDAVPAIFGFVLSWALVPVVCVSVVHAVGIAPLALVRYALVGYVALAIFAGLAMGRIQSKLVKGIAVGMLLLFAHQSNFLTQQLVDRGTLPHLRTENWGAPIGLINGDQRKAQQPVFVFANVIEDVDAFEIDAPDFQAYLRFPVSGLDVVEPTGRSIQACPTNRSPHLLPEHFARIAEQGGAWLLIRARAQSVNAIVAAVVSGVEERLVSTNRELTCQSTHHRIEGSDVYAVSIDLSSDLR